VGIMRKTSSCKTCSAKIIWCVNERGNRQPIDADPVVGGNIRIIHNPIPNCRVQPDIELFSEFDDGVRYLPHHMTCPDAEAWRRPAASTSVAALT